MKNCRLKRLYMLSLLAVLFMGSQAIALSQAVDVSPQTANTLVMVSPDDFGFNPETAKSNAFQHQEKAEVDVHEQAMSESDKMVKKLSDKGVRVIRLSSRPDVDTPDAVFPNNWFSIHKMSNGKRTMVLYPMLAPNRRVERQPERLKAALAKAGFEVQEVIDLTPFEEQGRFLEGTGSLVLDRPARVAFAVLSPRTDKEVLDKFARELGCRIVAFHSSDAKDKSIYHTNVIMGIGKKFAVICLESIKDKGEREMVVNELEKLGKTIVPITLEQVGNMCGNVIEIRGTNDKPMLLMSSTAYDNFTPEQKKIMERYCELCPVNIKTIENIGGGSARCMVAEVQ